MKVVYNMEAAVNISKMQSKLVNRVHSIQVKFDAQVLKDSNHYCPMDSGNLIKSGILNTVLGSGKIVWNTPYADAVYNRDFVSRRKNPNATSKWFETAKANRGKVWEKLLNDWYSGNS